MTSKKKTIRRLAAGVGALALGLTGVTAFATAASAAVDVGPDQPGAPTSGTLTINKYSGGHTANPNPENLLDGVEFTVTQVGRISTTDPTVCEAIDLTDAADWDGLSGLFASAPSTPAAPFCLTDVAQDDVTGTNGQVVFNLDVGIYFVQETDPGEHPIVSPVPDFYVSIPTSVGNDGTGWNYDVVADPKNQLQEEPTKTIEEDQEELVVGSTVEWTLDVPIPTLNNDETFNEAIITDVLDSRLEYVADSTVMTIGGTDLTQGTHYTVSDNLVWTFTEAGRAILDANMGGTLNIVFDTKVLEVGDGTIPNDDYESQFNGTPTPGTVVPYTYWGELLINKKDDKGTTLAGAEFQVFEASAAGTCADDAPATGAIATGTSNAAGVVQWEGATPASPLGLWVANSNGPLSDPFKVYCVYETVVPAGHTAVDFENAVTIRPGTSNLVTLNVVNARTDGPELPLTGAQGTLALTIVGLLLVSAGTGAILWQRHRRNQAA
ncbi:SpaH/EbpB family LPXTG-anchored major pilin [Gulosibacter chungangensis]|nr:SpaH/EbpB family LPXTG-anchored major pilin [Gulosibacter chungangensis]